MANSINTKKKHNPRGIVVKSRDASMMLIKQSYELIKS